ncbi:MAG: hypothetical protein M1358_25015 [Chloroflexi bacterium]|nr:hypothetical protein [Chloroflexota bacterium]
MSRIAQGAKHIVEHCRAVKAGEEVLIIIDDGARPLTVAQTFFEAIAALGAEPVLG